MLISRSPGISVDAVAQGRGEGVLPPGGPLLFLIEVGLNVGDESVHIFPLVRVAKEPGPLVAHHHVLVLVDDAKLRPEHRKEGVVLRGGVKEFIVDV